jgi:hypothetical protein
LQDFSAKIQALEGPCYTPSTKIASYGPKTLFLALN